METYAIGDVQGCAQRLQELLDLIRSESPAARLVFLGDLVNRGPQSLAALRRIRSLDNAGVVLGNHDLHLLAASLGIRKPHASDTVQEILEAPDRDELLDWLRRQPLAHFEDGHLMVHAGVLPQWSAADTLSLAGEVQAALRGPAWQDFLADMYGNQPARWDPALTGTDRLRCIVNALTRIRFCSADGTMDLSKTETAEPTRPGQLAWFDVPGRRSEEVTVVFGHWSTLGLVQRPNLIGLDTGCVWGGKLSAICLQNRRLLQVCCPQYQKPG